MEERNIKKTDNNPPEVLPVTLASVADLPVMMKADLEALKTEALAELDTYSRVPAEIADDAMYERATTLGTRLKAVNDKIEKRRKAVKQPYLDATKAIDGAFKLVQEADEEKGVPSRVLKEELDAAHAGIKRLLSDYDTKKFNEDQARQAEEREKLAQAAAADGITIDVQTAAPASLGTTKSAHGGSSVKNVVMDWEVVDESLLPRSVLSVDAAKVKALIDAGATEIPGMKLTHRVETHVRR